MNIARTLPQDTILLPGHEYTMANMKFAKLAEGETNPKIAEYTNMFQARLDSGKPTIPTTLKQEPEYNVFMRATVPVLQQAIGCTDPVQAMHTLRQWKNTGRQQQWKI